MLENRGEGMNLRQIFKLSSLLLIFIIADCMAAINFGERRSAIKVARGATLNVSAGMNVTEGSLVRDHQTGSVVSGETIVFDKGVLDSGGSESFITADYDPDSLYDTIRLNGSTRVRAEPGTIYQSVAVSGVNNFLEGQPTFREDITFVDANTTLTIGMQSALNKNINMNGGTIQLGDDLKLCDDIMLLVGGKVILDDRQFVFGGKDLSWSSTIFWDHASDMVLNSKIDLRSTWTFYGESHLVGNGNILDLTNGGTLWVKKDTTLHLKDIKIKGLGTGYIVFEDKSSQIRFSDVEVEMNRNYTVTEGGIYVEGPTTIITKDKLLFFDQRGSLTVDGVTLWYDVLNYGDKENIRPEPFFDTNDSNTVITLVHGGIIRMKAWEGEGGGEELGDLYYNLPATVNFTTNMYLSRDRRMMVNEDMTIDGNGHYIQFNRNNMYDRNPDPVIIIAEGKNLTFKNIVLKDFGEDHIGGVGQNNVLFDDGTTIELARSECFFERPWIFSGDCVLNGQDNYMWLYHGGEIVVRHRDSSLIIKNISLNEVAGNNLRTESDDGSG